MVYKQWRTYIIFKNHRRLILGVSLIGAGKLLAEKILN